VAETDAVAEGFERKLATILSADVAAYSRLMAEDEEETLRIFCGHKEVFEKLVGLHRGRIFNTAGDAILAEFGSAVEAVRCATEIQAALRTRNDKLPHDRRVEFRIGVNLGDVIVQGGDLLGDGVNLAARLQTTAAPGGICIAGSVYDQIRNKLSLSFTPLGEMNYKNIPQPVRTFAIAGADGLGRLPAPPPLRRKTGGARRSRRALAAGLLIIVVGAALWGHSTRQHHRAELRAAVARIEHTVATPVAQNPATDQPAAKAALQTAKSGPNRADNPDNRVTETSPNKATSATAAGSASPLAAAPSDTPHTTIALAGPATAGDLSGVYGGQICYGPGEADPAHCFHAQAIVMHHRILGEWPGQEPGATIYLQGEIRRSGHVTIHMHTQHADGSRFAVSDLVGTFRDGKIDAAGVFGSGRNVTLTWQKN
jgi:class 3 adenylate cyclase